MDPIENQYLVKWPPKCRNLSPRYGHWTLVLTGVNWPLTRIFNDKDVRFELKLDSLVDLSAIVAKWPPCFVTSSGFLVVALRTARARLLVMTTTGRIPNLNITWKRRPRDEDLHEPFTSLPFILGLVPDSILLYVGSKNHRCRSKRVLKKECYNELRTHSQSTFFIISFSGSC